MNQAFRTFDLGKMDGLGAGISAAIDDSARPSLIYRTPVPIQDVEMGKSDVVGLFPDGPVYPLHPWVRKIRLDLVRMMSEQARGGFGDIPEVSKAMTDWGKDLEEMALFGFSEGQGFKDGSPNRGISSFGNGQGLLNHPEVQVYNGWGSVRGRLADRNFMDVHRDFSTAFEWAMLRAGERSIPSHVLLPPESYAMLANSPCILERKTTPEVPADLENGFSFGDPIAEDSEQVILPDSILSFLQSQFTEMVYGGQKVAFIPCRYLSANYRMEGNPPRAVMFYHDRIFMKTAVAQLMRTPLVQEGMSFNCAFYGQASQFILNDPSKVIYVNDI